MEAFLLRCQALFEEVRGLVSNLDLLDAESLLMHGEPVEGVSNLAWALAATGREVPPHIVAAVRTLTEGWVDRDDLPSQFWAQT